MFEFLKNTKPDTSKIGMNDIYSTFPSIAQGMFISSTFKDGDNFNSFIANNDLGYLDELEKLGQAGIAPGTSKISNASNNPYSTKLMPLTDLSFLQNQTKTYIEDISFFPFNTLGATAGTGQSQAVIDEIINSFALDMGRYGFSQMKNGMMPFNWQPNFFRPQVKINGVHLIGGIATPNYQNEAHKTIGLPLPWCFNINKPLGAIKTIDVDAQLIQIVNVAGVKKYQRYPLLCVMTFRYGS